MQLISDGYFTIEIGGLSRDEPVNKGQRNGERQPSPLSIPHDFDVFPNLRKDGLQRGIIESMLSREHASLGFAQGRVPNGGGGIVRTDMVTCEDIREFGRTGPQLVLANQVVGWLDKPEMVGEPLLGGRLGDITHGNTMPLERRRGPVANDESHRRKDAAPSQGGLALSRHEKPFVDIVVQHMTGGVPIGPA